MKLISMHVENYGKIKNFDFEFKNNITQIFEENGYGKTTIASFIKAMFYGLPKVRQNSLTFDDRQRFYPYDNSKFGGSITIEKNGENYLIERYFDKKSDTKDEVKVYKNNLLIDLKTADLGGEFFSIDEQSFIRTLFFNSEFSEISSTAGINAKLNNFVENTSSENNFETALQKLEKRSKDYKKNKNGESFISKTQEKIKNLNEEIANLKTRQDNLQSKYSKRNYLKEKTNELIKYESQLKDQELRLEKWKRYQSYLEQIEKERALKEEILSKYDNKEFLKEDFDLLEKLSNNIQNLDNSLQNLTFSDQKVKKISELDPLFSGNNLNEETFISVKEDIENLKRLNTEQGTLSSLTDEEFIKLSNKFEGANISDGDLTNLNQKIDTYSKNATLIENYATTISTGVNQKQSRIGLTLISLILLVGGIGLTFLNLIAGIIMLLAGITTFILVNFATSKKSYENSAIIEVGKLKAENEIIEREIRTFLAPYNYYTNFGLLADFNSFLKDYNAYLLALDKKQENLKNIQGKLAEISLLTYKLDEFFKGFNAFKNYDENLDIIIENFKCYNSYKKEYSEFNTKITDLKNKMVEDKVKINQILEKYSIKDSQNISNLVKEIDKDLNNYKECCKRLDDLIKESQNYKNANNIDKKPEIIEVDLTNLKEYQRQLNLLDNEISIEEMDIVDLPNKESELESEKEKLLEYTFKYDMLTKTIEKLKQADDTLKEKYVAPIKERFLNYASVIEKVLGEKMVMDKDYSIKFMRNGEIRSYKHLSTGQIAICSLCLRLSLIDNMFPKDLPFVLMDDPFINLDKNHFESVKKVIKELSKNIQIIYFTCHESRQIV